MILVVGVLRVETPNWRRRERAEEAVHVDGGRGTLALQTLVVIYVLDDVDRGLVAQVRTTFEGQTLKKSPRVQATHRVLLRRHPLEFVEIAVDVAGALDVSHDDAVGALRRQEEAVKGVDASAIGKNPTKIADGRRIDKRDDLEEDFVRQLVEDQVGVRRRNVQLSRVQRRKGGGGRRRRHFDQSGKVASNSAGFSQVSKERLHFEFR